MLPVRKQTECWKDEQKWSGFVQKERPDHQKMSWKVTPVISGNKAPLEKSLAAPGQSQPHLSLTPSVPAAWRRLSTTLELAWAKAAEQSQAPSPPITRPTASPKATPSSWHPHGEPVSRQQLNERNALPKNLDRHLLVDEPARTWSDSRNQSFRQGLFGSSQGRGPTLGVLTPASPAAPPQEQGASPTWASATQAAGPQGKAKENLSLKYSQGF